MGHRRCPSFSATACQPPNELSLLPPYLAPASPSSAFTQIVVSPKLRVPQGKRRSERLRNCRFSCRAGESPSSAMARSLWAAITPPVSNVRALLRALLHLLVLPCFQIVHPDSKSLAATRCSAGKATPGAVVEPVSSVPHLHKCQSSGLVSTVWQHLSQILKLRFPVRLMSRSDRPSSKRL